MSRHALMAFVFVSGALACAACSSSSNASSPVPVRRDAASDTAKDAANDVPNAEGAPPDASQADGFVPDAGRVDGSSACNGLSNVATVISDTGDTQNPLPQATGGSVADGTYVLTASTQYALDSNGIDQYIICGSELADRQETIRFQGGTVDTIGSFDEGPQETFSGTFTTSGTTLTQRQTCPTASTTTAGYSVIGNKILLIGPPGGTDSNGTCGPFVFELTRQ